MDVWPLAFRRRTRLHASRVSGNAHGEETTATEGEHMPTSRTSDKVRGSAEKAAGKVKEKVSRDPIERAKGVAKQDKGELKNKKGHVKDLTK
jgi:uncharacterized protein YjbJ (UPF0337 family)